MLELRVPGRGDGAARSPSSRGRRSISDASTSRCHRRRRCARPRRCRVPPTRASRWPARRATQRRLLPRPRASATPHRATRTARATPAECAARHAGAVARRRIPARQRAARAGSPHNEVLRTVTLTRPFYMAATEVSNAQFRTFRASHAAGIALEKSLDLDNAGREQRELERRRGVLQLAVAAREPAGRV